MDNPYMDRAACPDCGQHHDPAESILHALEVVHGNAAAEANDHGLAFLGLAVIIDPTAKLTNPDTPHAPIGGSIILADPFHLDAETVANLLTAQAEIITDNATTFNEDQAEMRANIDAHERGEHQ